MTDLIVFRQGGRFLAGGTAFPCPQSIRLTPTLDVEEYICPTLDGTQRIMLGKNWTGEVTWKPEEDDHADMTRLNGLTLLACTADPAGTANGNMRITFSSYIATGLEAGVGASGNATSELLISGDVTFAAIG
jgi:hypothetical protein